MNVSVCTDGVSVGTEGVSVCTDGVSVGTESISVCTDGVNVWTEGVSVHTDGVIKTRHLMLYWEIIAVCSQIHIKYINTLCDRS